MVRAGWPGRARTHRSAQRGARPDPARRVHRVVADDRGRRSVMMTTSIDWREYLAAFHGTRPGITEKVLAACVGDPYGWLVDAIPASARRGVAPAAGHGPR